MYASRRPAPLSCTATLPLLTAGLPAAVCVQDMIGGNAYFGVRPDSELMVRWTQLNALMPAMQFSIAPWDLNRETEKMVASALAVRQKVGGRMEGA